MKTTRVRWSSISPRESLRRECAGRPGRSAVAAGPGAGVAGRARRRTGRAGALASGRPQRAALAGTGAHRAHRRRVCARSARHRRHHARRDEGGRRSGRRPPPRGALGAAAALAGTLAGARAPRPPARCPAGAVSLRRVRRILRSVARRAARVFMRLLSRRRDGSGGRAVRQARADLPQAQAAAGAALSRHRCGLGCAAAVGGRTPRCSRHRHHAVTPSARPCQPAHRRARPARSRRDAVARLPRPERDRAV